ncbi:MAG TPA: cache domain-containing protein [archaeon]|nr:cache domain-containing protein [archaeon]
MKNKAKKSMGITAIIVLVVVGVLALNFAAINFIQNSITANAIREGGQSQLLVAERISSILESEIENLKSDVTIISKFSSIASGDTEACSKKLEELSPIYEPKLSSFAFINTKGIIDCAADKNFIGADRSDQLHIKKILADENHAPVISDFGKGLGGRWSIAFYTPVYNEEKNFIGALGGRIIFGEISSDYFQNITSFRGTRLLILDSDGEIVYYSNNPDLRGKNWWSEKIQEEFGGNEDFNNLVKDSAWGKSGTGKATLLKTENIVSYTNMDLFSRDKLSVIVSSPVRNVISESAGEPTAFALLYAGSALVVIVIVGAVLTLMSGVARYVIEDMAEKIVERKNRKRKR